MSERRRGAMGLFGRHDELDDVLERLAQRRLVTICGPGGVGKTALARAAAARAESSYPLGAVEVDLTRIDDDEAVFEAMASQLGYADFDSLRDSPGDKPALLVVDNCEHVIDAAAEAVSQILEARAQPTILTTSRAPLDVDGESIVSIRALPAPPVDLDDPSIPSMQLLLARARDHGVELGPGDLSAAAEVCRRLDGVPLAIELAAARLRTVGLDDLLAQLADAPHALARRRHRGQARHRSVADVVNWSYRLLTKAEQQVFDHLGVFAGPFTGAMARAVVVGDPTGPARPDSPVDTGEWEAALEGLVAASLVVVERSSGPTRYRLLHPVRAVAIDRLERSGAAPDVRSRLVDQIIARSFDIVRGGPKGWHPMMLHELLDQYDNAVASLRWMLANDDRPERALTIVALLWGMVHNAHAREIHELGEVVLRRWPDPTVGRWPTAAATVATCRFLAGDPEGAIELATDTLPHADRSRTAPATLRRVIAQSRRALGDIEGCRIAFGQAAAAAEEREAHGLTMELRVDEALATVETGGYDEGLAAIEIVIAEADRRGASINRVWARTARAAVLVGAKTAGCRQVAAEALAEAKAISYPAGITYGLRSLALAQLHGGDIAGSARTQLELLDGLLQRGGLDEMRTVLDLAAEVMRRRGDNRWPDLVATALVMPITSFVTMTRPAFTDDSASAVPDTVGSPLAVREAYVICRQALVAAADAAGRHDPDDAGATDSVDQTVSTPVGELVSEGDVWRLSYRDRTVRLRRSKGLEDLSALLEAAGRDVAAVTLAGVSIEMAGGSEVIDSTARARYEDRVRELQADIEQADSDNDPTRAERARVELDQLVDALTQAVGLGGRSRQTADEAERARSAVTQRLRSAIRRIDAEHPILGAHLAASITTGTFCAYRPPEPVLWRVIR